MNIVQLAESRGLDPKRVSSTGGGEFHSGCPECGGKDRFYMQPDKQQKNCVGFFACRQCGISGDIIQFAKDYCNYTFEEALRAFGNKVNFGSPKRLSFTVKYPEPIKAMLPPEKWSREATCFVKFLCRDIFTAYDEVDDIPERTCEDGIYPWQNRDPDRVNKILLTLTKQMLSKRGLNTRVLATNDIVYNLENQWLKRADWGLSEELSAKGKPKLLWIPKGIVIPSKLTDGTIVGLRIRRDDWKEGDEIPKYVVVSGSMNGMNVVSYLGQKAAIIVESELDAFVLDDIIHDQAFAVATGSALKNPDAFTDEVVKNAKILLVCHDNDEAGWKMMGKWRTLYPRARSFPVPYGKDIGEAIQMGFDVREWILEELGKQSKEE